MVGGFVALFWYCELRCGTPSQMTATGIVALFSALSAASKGAHGSVDGMLAMLSAMRYVNFALRFGD